MWPPRGPQTQDTRGCQLWTVLQKPRTPLGQHLWAPWGLLSARLLCLVMWVGQTQGHMTSDMKSPPERQMVTWKRRPRLEKQGLLPEEEPVSSWRVVPSCYPEHPEGLSLCWAGSPSGHTGGKEGPQHVSKRAAPSAGGVDGGLVQPLSPQPRILGISLGSSEIHVLL